MKRQYSIILIVFFSIICLILTSSCQSGSLSKIKQGFADVNDTRLYYEQIGKGHPLVLIHGFTLDTRMWDDQFESFGKQYQVVRYDLRGYGKSELPTMEEYNHTDDLKALMDHLEISNAYVIGLSMGGAIAIRFTLDYPEYVDALISVDATLGGYRWSPNYGTSLDSISIIGREVDHNAALQKWLDFVIFEPAMENPEVANRLNEIIIDYSGYHWCSDTVNWGTSIDPRAIHILDEIHVPTLVIVGSLDAPDFDTIASILEENIRDARKVVIDNVGHVSNMEKPEEFNEIVLDFLNGIEK